MKRVNLNSCAYENVKTFSHGRQSKLNSNSYSPSTASQRVPVAIVGGGAIVITVVVLCTYLVDVGEAVVVENVVECLGLDIELETVRKLVLRQ